MNDDKPSTQSAGGFASMFDEMESAYSLLCTNLLLELEVSEHNRVWPFVREVSKIIDKYRHEARAQSSARRTVADAVENEMRKAGITDSLLISQVRGAAQQALGRGESATTLIPGLRALKKSAEQGELYGFADEIDRLLASVGEQK